jgi:hypothetical protein
MMFRRSLFALLVLSITPCSAGAEAQDWSCTNCFSEVSSGEAHNCAIREDGSLVCWGYDFFGQATVPELDPEWYDFVQVSSGGYHTCAVVECTPPPGQFCILANGLCWGNDDDGQATPYPGAVYDHIVAGRYHSCGLKTDNEAVCWGRNDQGQTEPTPPMTTQFIQISAGAFHNCGIIECLPGHICMWPTNVSCWGFNGWGQTSVIGLPNDFVQVSAGWYHNCGVRESGAVECWGRDDYDQSTQPTRFSFQSVSAGGYHTCGLTIGGTIRCWGRDDFGQSNPPEGLFTSVSAGAFHSCAVRPDGSVVCWGSDNDNRTIPTAGLCGLFNADFEVGGDCRWSNGSTPCWTFDCDGDGYVPADSESICAPSPPLSAPPGCPFPGGAWIDQTGTCGAYDCMDENPFVFSGQTSWYPVAYIPEGGPDADRFDFNCDGNEEKQFGSLSTSLCCATVGGPCLAVEGPGCDLPGWDSSTVSEVPACGETADFLTCETTKAGCVQTVDSRTQTCR